MNQAVDALATLSALCRRSFGPSGDEVLLFAPPDAPVITGDGHAVLRAWQQAGQSNNAMERVILDSVEGVYKPLGDGTTQFVIMMQSMMTQLHAIAGKDSTLSKNAMRIRLALELASIRREWDRSLLTSELKLGHVIKTTIELDPQTHQPTGEFKVRLQQILLTALAGTLGEHVIPSVTQLVSAWVLQQPLRVDTTRAELYARVDRYLTQAVEVILHAQGSSFTQSQILPDNEIILRKSLISTQPPGMLSKTQARVAFVCFSCPLSSLAGSNHVAVESSAEVAASFSHTASLISGITSFFTTLREQLDVRLILSMERIDRDIVTTCTRLGIACVQHVEREELDTLCAKAGIYPLASVFDSVQVDRHIGLCDRVSTIRLEKTACLHLHGVCLKQGSSELLVPQLIIRAPSKGIYKQYYNAVLKSLRVLRSWFQSPTAENIEDVVVLSCRGAGAFELCVAKLLRSRSSQRTGAQTHEHYTVMEVIATALGESVAQLRTNIAQVSGGDAAEGSVAKASQRFLLEDLSARSVSDSHTGLIFDTRHTISIGAGSVLVPQVIVGDPLAYGVIHPWSRFETLLHVLFQLAEQLLRVDYILPVARCRRQGIEMKRSFEDDEDGE